MNYRFDWSVLWTGQSGQWLLSGLITTLELSACAWILAVVLGILSGALRTVPYRGLRVIATFYVEFFQLWIAGNSSDKTDLHGACATPRAGWDNIDYQRDSSWPTVYARGICLYFNPYKSPAITEKDDQKRARLAKFLITTSGIEQAIEDFHRGMMGRVS